MSLCEPCQRLKISSNAAYLCRNCGEKCCEGCRKDHLKFLELQNHQIDKIDSNSDVPPKPQDQKQQVTVKQIINNYENVGVETMVYNNEKGRMSVGKMIKTDQEMAVLVNETYANDLSYPQNTTNGVLAIRKMYDTVKEKSGERTSRDLENSSENEDTVVKHPVQFDDTSSDQGGTEKGAVQAGIVLQTTTSGVSADSEDASDHYEIPVRRIGGDYVNIRPQSEQMVEHVAANKGTLPDDILETFQGVRVSQSELSEKIGISGQDGHLTVYPKWLKFSWGDRSIDLAFAWIRRFGMFKGNTPVFKVELGRRFSHGEGLLYFETTEASKIKYLIQKQIVSLLPKC